MEITGNGCSSGNEKEEKKYIVRSGMMGITWDHVFKAKGKTNQLYIYMREREQGVY